MNDQIGLKKQYLNKIFTRKIFMQLMCMSMLLLMFTAHAAIRVTKLQVSSQTQQAQLYFSATGPIRFSSFTLKKPARIVVDIKNVRVMPEFSSALLLGTPISDIRAAIHPGNVLRLVFDLSKSVRHRIYVLKPMGSVGYRLVLDLSSTKSAVAAFNWPFKKAKRVKAKPHYNVIAPTPPKPVVSVSTPSLKKTRDLIVVIDPGHGGKDPGAAGRRTREKNVVLAIAIDLQRLINQQAGFKAVLTRSGDYYLTLRQRLSIARKYKADMYVSIHADAYPKRSARGASVFALSPRGATSEAARWLAKRENESELMGGVSLSDKSNLLRSVLINLSQTATIRASLQIGQDMLGSLSRVTRLHHNRVEQAAFVVLKSPDIPSLLVESGFISNPYEERLLRSTRYRKKLANALMIGIKDYFLGHPPRGTWLAYWRDHPRSHVVMYRVKRGDTLSSIAQRYRISMARLRTSNHLRSYNLRVGQRLSIPG